MSTTPKIKATVNGQQLPGNTTLASDFLINVMTGDAYSMNGKRSRVKEKEWGLSPTGEIEFVGLITEPA
ncbi:hypothetical protein [Pseudomonas cremoris]|uniref:hypothetical protein n=1 Tax=Pseudomonas cremoris TaxID=2724178 RepID=UPI002899F153|nr:hypothetical protein [Pseudomonas cremoris]